MIFKGMILPCITYNSTANLKFTRSQTKRFQTMDNMVAKLIKEKQRPILNEIHNHSLLLVRKCLENKVCENFVNYFDIKSHQKVTRNNGFMINLPKVKLHYSRSGFYFMAGYLYNALPLNVRKLENFNQFKRSILEN